MGSQQYDHDAICVHMTLHGVILIIAGISSLSRVRILQPDEVVLLSNLFFKINVSLPLVTRELLQNMVDVTSENF